MAPVALKVLLMPAQIEGGDTVTLGAGVTITLVVAVPVQPAKLPLTVYVLVTTGDTTCGFNEGVTMPGPDQVYVAAPDAVMLAV